MIRRFGILTQALSAMLALPLAVYSEGLPEYIPEIMPVSAPEAVTDPAPDPDASQEPPHKRNFISSIIQYFEDANKESRPKGFDISFIGGPHYNSDTKLGLGMVAAGLYLNDKNDTVTIPSNVSLYADITTSGFYMIGIRGNNIFPGDRQRIAYDLYFSSFPRYYWGIGYHNNRVDSLKSKFDQRLLHISASYVVRLAENFYAGPTAEYSYTKAKQVVDTALWQGQPLHIHSTGLGVTLSYDSRDNLTATHSGVYLQLNQMMFPRFLGNKFAFSYTELRAMAFFPAWKGATIATSLHGKCNYGNVPWPMMATFGGSYSMRGYYEGRYNDKCEIDATVELRQHVYHRSGAVAWAGIGTVFPNFSQFSMHRLLPCAGIGYRWEFKKNTNVRLDFGIGRGCSSFIFGINEAF